MGVMERGLRASKPLVDGDEHTLVPETGRRHPVTLDPRGQAARQSPGRTALSVATIRRLTQGRGSPPRSDLPHYAL